MRPLLLRGGRVIDPAAGIDGRYDVLANDGKIAAVAPGGTLAGPEDADLIDCAGLWILPGLIDAHVHLRDPGFPEKETILSGLRAAAAGGFTAVAAMANTNPVNDAPEIARHMLALAAAAGGARLIPISAVTRGLAGRELVDFAAMAAAGARLFSDDGMPIDDAALLREAFSRAAGVGFAISLHEEDRALTGQGCCHAGAVAERLGVAGIPTAAEAARIRRDLAIAADAGAPAHIAHISTAEGLRLVRAAKARGVNVTCEAAPHHFTLDDAAFARHGPNAKMAPPLRAAEDLAAIRAGLADGAIDLIATDHAPHDPASKRMARFGPLFPGDREAAPLTPEDAAALAGAANGVVGLETALGLALELVHNRVIDASRMAALMAANPARLLRLERQGTLMPGALADVSVIDPDAAWTVAPEKFLSKSRNTPFGGKRLKGAAAITIVNGRIVYRAHRDK